MALFGLIDDESGWYVLGVPVVEGVDAKTEREEIQLEKNRINEAGHTARSFGRQISRAERAAATGQLPGSQAAAAVGQVAGVVGGVVSTAINPFAGLFGGLNSIIGAPPPTASDPTSLILPAAAIGGGLLLLVSVTGRK